MKKVMICLTGCFLLALATVRAQNAGKPAADSVIQLRPDTATQTPAHSVISRDTNTNPIPDTSFRYRGDTSTPVQPAPVDPTQVKVNPLVVLPSSGTKPAADTNANPVKADQGVSDQAKTDQVKADQAKADQPAVKDTATADDRAEEKTRELDRRWFISPLLKFQFQDFALLEKNRKGYLSDANSLPFFQRGNGSFAASAYKNLTQRLSVSADLGLSFGHVTNDNVLISQTKKQTFNLINAAIYYHLISPAYRLQPYVTVGFNDIINNGSYPSLPMGVGAKFNSRKVMVMGQVTYGYGLSKSISNTTMYAVGIYIPIKSKKSKQLDKDNDNSQLNRAKDDAKKKDSTNKNGYGPGSVVVNNYITINMDSILKAKGLLDDDGNPFNGNGGSGKSGNGRGRYARGGRNGGGGGDDDDGGDDAASRTRRRKKPFKSLGLDDFSDNDYHIDSLDGQPTVHFVIYFEFNEYALNSSAFNSIDKVIGALRHSPEFTVEIKGYTDSVGSDPYNNMLSRKRSKMVLDYMNSRGVPVELMKAKAYGSDNPVADNSDPNQAWLNRRAEIIVHRKELASQ